MGSISRVLFFIGLALAATVAPSVAQSDVEVNERIETLLGDAGTFAVAFEVLQQAVGAGDAATVASLVRYPLNVVIDGERTAIGGEGEFIARYGDIVTRAVASAVTDQAYADLFVNGDGVMFGDGEVWMTSYCTDSSCEVTYWLIRAINIPE